MGEDLSPLGEEFSVVNPKYEYLNPKQACPVRLRSGQALSNIEWIQNPNDGNPKQSGTSS